MNNLRSFTCSVFLSAISALLLLQQTAYSQSNVVKEDGTTIEFIGLKQWSMQRLQDSVRKRDPKCKLGFCAATLKSDLGFSDASVTWLSKDSLIVTVVEPQDTALVRRNTNFTKIAFISRQWDEFQEKYSYKVFEKDLLARCQGMSDDSASIVLLQFNRYVKVDSLTFWNMRTALKQNSISVKELSAVLMSSFDPYSRGIAVLALSSLPDNDTCLAAVVHALLDIAATTSTMNPIEGLDRMLQRRTLPITLKPMIPDLQRLANGTNLFAYWNVLKLISMAKPTEQEFNEIFASDQARRLLYAHLTASAAHPRTLALKLVNAVNPKFSSLVPKEQKQFLKIQ